MNKILSTALLVGGIALLVYGISASNSVGSDVSRAVTGNPTDKSMWLLIGGAIAAAAGSVGLFRGPKSS